MSEAVVVASPAARASAATPRAVEARTPADLMRKRFGLVRAQLGPRASFLLGVGAFILPLLLWSAVSYLPFLWHPKVLVSDPGDVSYFMPDMLVDKTVFDEE